MSGIADRRASEEARLLVIQPATGWTGVPLRELWAFRELLILLVWREIKIRYRQTVLGAAWAILQPLTMMATFAVFFGKMAGLAHTTGSVAYPIYVYAGLLPWLFFAASVQNGAASVHNNSTLITKIYFPRLVIPLASVGAALVDFAVSFAVLVVLMIVYGTALTWQLVLFPALLVVTIAAATAVATIFSALTVAYRDFRYVIPFVIQLGMFLTPIIYPITILPARWRWLLRLNPMAGLIDGFRSALLGVPADWSGMGIAVLVTGVLLWIGAYEFRRLERRFADLI